MVSPKASGGTAWGKQETLETIWEVPDELWERIEPIILEEDPPKARGRKRSDPRQMLNGIIFRLRSGCQWNRLPKELGDDSTIHRTFQRWVGRASCTECGEPWWRGAKSGWRGLGMAGGRRSHGQGTFWGDLIGPTLRTVARLVPSAVSLWMEGAAP